MAKTGDVKVPTLEGKVVEREYNYICKVFGVLFQRGHLYSKGRFLPNRNENRLLAWQTNYYMCLLKPGVGRNRY